MGSAQVRRNAGGAAVPAVPHRERVVRATAAFAAAACTIAGTVAVLLAVRAGPDPGFGGYVSEAGTGTADAASTYRLGVFGVAAGLVLLAVALPSTARIAAALLGTGAAGTVVSGAVPCTDGCPLPPYESVGLADLVHGGASIGAVAAGVFAMLALCRSVGVSRAVRRVAAVAAVVSLPLSAIIGLGMLVVGRGLLVGVVERLLLGVGVLWLGTTALRFGVDLLLRRPSRDAPAGRRLPCRTVSGRPWHGRAGGTGFPVGVPAAERGDRPEPDQDRQYGDEDTGPEPGDHHRHRPTE
ncbi:DUF998 domain-containing protein [Plantactinospora sp. B24E8]|uniref:DUF998 domain-containing protein n=1 Tax=Plantactinospora sp. B24E8 TaxID=3153567 RepID=UPI00325E5A18